MKGLLVFVFFTIVYCEFKFHSLHLGRDGMNAINADQYALFAGGRQGRETSDILDVYNCDDNSWSTEVLPTKKSSFSSVSDGKFAYYAGGTIGGTLGIDVDSVDIYDPINSSWKRITLSLARHDLGSAAIGDLVLFAGGISNGLSVSTVDIYNTRINSFQPIAYLSEPRGFIASVTVSSFVLFAGGSNSGTKSSLVDIFSYEERLWSTASLSAARISMGVTSTGSYAFFAGGADYNNDMIYDIIDVYHAATNKWTTLALSEPRDFPATTSVGNLVVFAGGQRQDGSVSDALDVFDTVSFSWKPTATMLQGRKFLSAVAVCNMALLAGGTMEDGTQTDVVTAYIETMNLLKTDNFQVDTQIIEVDKEPKMVSLEITVCEHTVKLVAGGKGSSIDGIPLDMKKSWTETFNCGVTVRVYAKKNYEIRLESSELNVAFSRKSTGNFSYFDYFCTIGEKNREVHG